jgi:pilus assembly protein CpaB
MKQKLILIVAILAGLIAFGLTVKYLQKERDKIIANARRIEVVVAASDLPAGSVLKQGDLAKDSVFQRSVGTRVILPDSVREIYGKKLLFNINRGDPIQWSDVDVPFRGETGLAETITPGMRAIAISVDAVSSVSSMIKPNDRVDVLGTFSFPSSSVTGEMETVTLTVLQDVTVLAAGQRMAQRDSFRASDRAERTQRGYSTITFEVTPREAELLVFAQTVRGRLYLSLRNPADVSFVKDMPEINFEHLENKLPELNLIRQRDIRHKKDL